MTKIKVQVYQAPVWKPKPLIPGEAAPRQHDSRKTVYKPSDFIYSKTGLAKWN